MSWRGRPGLVALSVLVSLLTMGLWLRNFRVSPEELGQLFARLRGWPILPLFALLVGHVALSAWRWSLIEIGLGAPPPRFRHAFIAGAIALGLGTFLPASAINVACRSFANRINGTSGLRGALSGGIDQMADLIVVVLMSVPATIAFLAKDLRIFVLGAAAMVLLGGALTQVVPRIMQWVLQRFPIAGAGRILSLTHPRLLLKLYGISLLRVANLTIITLGIHAATGAATVGAIVIGVPLVTLAISAAMLPGGFGVSEWSFSAVFAHFGIARSEIVLFVLANRIVLTVLSLALALLVLLAMIPALLYRWQNVDKGSGFKA